MFRIFNKPLINQGYLISPNLHRLKELVFKQYINQMIQYRKYGDIISGNHILLKLCYILLPYIEEDPDIKKTIKRNEHSICSALGITSETTQGISHKRAFYTKDCLILSTTFKDSIFKVKWKPLRTVRCLSHPFTTLSLHVPATLSKYLKEGTSIVAIDLPLFGYQFQKWFLENKLKPREEQETYRQFVTMYTLPGMIKEQVDIALRNQLLDIYRGEPIPKGKSDPRGLHYDFDSVLHSYNVELSYEIKNRLNVIKIGKYPYIKALANIPLIFKESFLEAIPLNQNGLNQNCYWLNLILYTDWTFRFIKLIDDNKTTNTNINRVLERVERTINSTKADTTMSSKSAELWYRWFSQFEEIKKIHK